MKEITKICGGYVIRERIENPDKWGYSDYILKMHYLYMTKKECIKSFNRLKRETMQKLNYYHS